MYGDIATAEEYGYVSRGLKSRHIQFIALGGTIGTGLFLGIGRAFLNAGPLSVLLGYTFTGVAVFAMMYSLGEMATWLPLPGAIPQFCARYVDDAMGFAVGWNNWYSCSITLCAEISAASTVIQFWDGARDINVAAWISLVIVLVLCLNIFAVSIYGEAEFIFASIKIITIIGLLILALIIDVGGVPGQHRLGFQYWRNPGAMKPYIAGGSTGRFLGLWSTLVNAAFSYGGVEMVAVAAGEAEDPRRNIPKAVRRVFWRILFFYVLGSLAIGVLVPSNDENLINARETGAAGAAQSPWVIAISRAGIDVLLHYQCRHLDFSLLVRQRLLVHWLTLPVRSCSEPSGAQIPAQVLQEWRSYLVCLDHLLHLPHHLSFLLGRFCKGLRLVSKPYHD